MRKRPVVIIGYGGHGRVLAAALKAAGRRVIAGTDLNPSSSPYGLEIISDDELEGRFGIADVELALGIGGIWPTTADCSRYKAVERFTELGYHFTGVVHPRAWVADDVELATTAQVHAGAIVQPGTRLGEHCIVNTGASVDHDGRIGQYCHIGPGATLSGNVVVGAGSHLGTGAVVIQGLTLGEGCLVAAGATVVTNVAPAACVRGTPAKEFKPNR